MNNYYKVVLDIGQFLSKIGYGGESKPRETFYTITGKNKYRGIGLDEATQNQLFIGNKVYDQIGLYKVNHPIGKGGEIEDWGEFKAIIEHVFILLGVDPGKCQVLYAANPFLSIGSHKRIAELFLSEFQAGGYYPVRTALLSMYSGGFDTGLIVDIGANYTRITPIYKSYILKHAMKIIPLGGSVLDSFMISKLASGWSKGQRNKFRLLKERACFTSMNFDKDMQNPEKFRKEYEFSDSSRQEIGVERFLIPELLFQPKLHNFKSDSLVIGILNAINECDVDIRRELLYNIYLTGGTSSIPLLGARLKLEIEAELTNRQQNNPNVRIIPSKEGIFANWVGGSTLSMISAFQAKWLTQESFNEKGLPEDILSY